MVLILVAVEEELSSEDLPNFQIQYTGVGKINAAIKTLEIIKDYSPTQIINYGTAGSLNKNLEGADHALSADARDLNDLVKARDTIFTAMGTGVKKATLIESLAINAQRKSVFTRGKILKGEERRNFEVSKIKIDVMKSNLIAKYN